MKKSVPVGFVTCCGVRGNSKVKRPHEAGFIERVSERIKVDNSVIRGIGDDAAVIKWKKGKLLLFTSDMIIEGVHFDLKRSSPFRIGWKALGINISDIAAMGGLPRYATISLGLPRDLNLRFLDGIYSGIRSMAKKFNVNITGGDSNSSKRLIIDIAVIGEVNKDELTLRSGARLGDVIMVTGKLGGSIKGKHLSFIPRIREAQFLVKNFKINSMIDISDGLSTDLAHICRKSLTGARIYESLIPLSKEANSIKAALSDGEDFELLFTVSKKVFKNLTKKFKRGFKIPITAVGEVTDRSAGIKIINRYGKVSPLKEEGFRHF